MGFLAQLLSNLPFGGEGIGYSVRQAIAWQEDVPYTFRMRRQED